MTLRVAIDTGGTFTDLVVLDSETGALVTVKVSSDARDPGTAVISALRTGGVDASVMSNFSHGTTVGTNALIERRGCRLAFLATDGFEDIAHIQRTNRRVLYDLKWSKPVPLVESRKLCVGVPERLGADGSVVRALDEPALRALCQELRALEPEAVAVCFLFSYLRPHHEQVAKRILREAMPGIPVSVSHEVAPIWREYDRASTTIADAYLKPLLTSYVASLEGSLAAEGFSKPWTIMKSNGGVMLAEATPEAPIQTIMSGPAGGMMASERICRQLEEPNVLVLDMGGTSADVGIIVDGRATHTTTYEIEWGLPASVPLIDIKSIGAGGGSIAWIDGGGLLRVGPRSAGPLPGPACYGRGGKDVTVTDANVALGRIDTNYFADGRMTLHPQWIDGPLNALAERFAMSAQEMAASIVAIANENMASAVKLVSLERGYDPRRFALLAYGGAGPLHAAAVARALGIPRVIVPPQPGVFSALGILLADLRVDKVWTQALRSIDADAKRVNREFERISAAAVAELRVDGYSGEPVLRRAISMRYQGQNYEHEVPLLPGVVDQSLLDDAYEDFHRRYRDRYGYAMEGEVIELVSFNITAIGPRAPVELTHTAAPSDRPAQRRAVFFREAGVMDTLVRHRSTVAPGVVVPGPAVIAEEGSTILVGPDMRAEATRDGVLIIWTGAES